MKQDFQFPADATPTTCAMDCVTALLRASLERGWDKATLRKVLLILVCRIAADGEPDDAALLEEVRLVLAQNRATGAPQH